MSNSKKASQTALMAAIHRYLATTEEDPQFKGPDHLAKIFLPGKVKFLLSFEFIRKSVKKKMNRLVPGTYPYVTARTRHFDVLFKQAIDANIPQIVFLGAGYDSRAIRFKAALSSTTVFELDEPAIQHQKRKLLNKAKLELPDQLRFLPIDFHKDDLADILVNGGFEVTKKTLFLWEGVSMYLEERAVADVLTFISEKSGPGSTITFDYFDAAILGGNSNAYGAKEISAEVTKSGEPFRFGIDPKQVAEFLKESGFELVSHLTPEQLEQKYLTNENNMLLGKVYGFGYQVVAVSSG